MGPVFVREELVSVKGLRFSICRELCVELSVKNCAEDTD
jgi:hypothetical protein